MTHRGLNSNHTFSDKLDPMNGNCTTHIEKRSIYCLKCQEIICSQCTRSSGTHFQHYSQNIQESVIALPKPNQSNDERGLQVHEDNNTLPPKDSDPLDKIEIPTYPVMPHKIVFNSSPLLDDILQYESLQEAFRIFVKKEG
jgi:hypothetical protein